MKKLQLKKVEYEEVNDVSIMIEKGFMSAPMLEVDDVVMDFNEACKWINNQEA